MSRRVEVRVVNGQVAREPTSTPSPTPEVAQRSGAALAKDIVDDQLRKIEQQARSQKTLDPEAVRTLKDLVGVYDTLKSTERKDKLESGLLDKLKGKSKAELLEIAGAKLVGDDE